MRAASEASPRACSASRSAARTQRASPVTAWVGGDVTSLAVTVSLVWPHSARTTTRRLRDHIAERVQTLTGLRVDHVDIDVTQLPSPSRPARRVR